MTTVNGWLNRAVSKDETRYSLNQVWRDKEESVATDGHRLHIYKELNRIENPVNKNKLGDDYDYPDYKQVIPVTNSSDKVMMPVTKELVTLLNTLLKTCKKSDQSVDIAVSEDRLTISYLDGFLSWSFGITVDSSFIEVRETRLNLKYFIDALLEPETKHTIAHHTLYIPNGTSVTGTAIVIQPTDRTTAILMPVKRKV